MALKVGELFASFGIDQSGLDKSISSIEKKCNDIGKSLAITGAALSAAVTAPLVGASKDIINIGTEFDAQMSRVKAISGATEEAFESLRDTALDMASNTSFTAQQTGEALEYMGMAGWDAQEMIAGLPAILDLAAASGENLGTVSDIVTDALTAFGLQAEDAAMFADVLAAASTSANTNVHMMGESFKFVAPLAGSMGYSVQDVAVALSLMANSGVKASMAGTSLRNIIQNMQNPTEDQAEAMKELGLSLYDASGGTKSFATLMKDMRGAAKDAGIDTQALHDIITEYDKQLAEGVITQEEYDAKLSDLTKGSGKFMKAVSTLVGARGLSGMLAIMNASDEEFDELTESIRGSTGAAHEMSEEMLNNLNGDLVKFNSALDVAKVHLSDLVKDGLRPIVQKATDYVNAFRNMDDSTQLLALKMAGLAAAAGPVMTAVGGLIAALPKVVPLMQAIVSPAGIAAGALALFAVAAVDADNVVGRTFENFSSKAAEALHGAQSSIESFISTASARIPALAQSITDGLATLIPAIVETAGTLVSSFIKTISDNASSVAEIGVTLVTGLITSIANEIEKHSLIEETAQMLVNIGKAIIENAPKLLNAGLELGKAIIDGIISTDWTQLALDLGKSIVKAAGDIKLPSLEDVAGKIVNAISGGMDGNNFSGIGDFVKKLAGKIADFDWTNVGTYVSTIATNFISALAEKIRGLGDLAVDIIEALGTIISGKFGTSFITSATTIATDLIATIAGEIPGLFETAKNIISSLGTLISNIPWSEAGSALGTIVTNLVDSIVTTINGGGFDFAGIIEALGEGIVAVSDGLSSFAGRLIEKLITFLLDPENYAKLVEAGSKIAWQIVKGYVIAAEKTAEAAGTALGNVIVSVSRAMLGVEVDPLIEEMQLKFAELTFKMNDQFWEGGEACGLALMEAMEAALISRDNLGKALSAWNTVVESGFAEYFPKFQYLGNESAMSIYRGLIVELENGNPSVVATAEQCALLVALGYGDNFENTLYDEVPGITEAMEEILEGPYTNLSEIAAQYGYDIGAAMGVKLPEGYEIAIKDNQLGIVDTTTGIIYLAEDTLEKGWTLDKTMAECWDLVFSTTLNDIDMKWRPELISTLTTLGIDAGDIIGVSLPDGVAQGLNEGQIAVEDAALELIKAASGTGEAVKDAVEASAQTGVDVGQALADNESGQEPDVTAASETLETAAIDPFTVMPEELGAISEEAMAGLTTAITDSEETATAAALSVSDSVVKQFLLTMSQENGNTIGVEWVNSVKGGMESVSITLTTSADNIAKDTKNAFGNVLTFDAGNNIGIQFDNGIANGISKGAYAISSAAKKAAQNALYAAKKELGIASPSEVAKREIGYMFDEGIAVGLLERLSAISDATERVSDTLMGAQYIGEPSRGTVYTSAQAAKTTAHETAMANTQSGANVDAAKIIGECIARYLIESDALSGDVLMDGTIVGKKTSKAVSRSIYQKTNSGIMGRVTQGVISR